MLLETNLIEWFNNHFMNIIFTVLVIFTSLVLLILFKFIFAKIKKGKNTKASSLASLIYNIIKVIIFVIAVFIVIAIWGMNPTIGLVILCTLLIIIGLGCYSSLNDLTVGISNIFSNMYEVDDYVEINGFVGKVVFISLTRTQIEASNGEIKTISNGLIKEVTNYSKKPINADVYVSIENVNDIFTIINKLEEKLVLVKDEYPQIIEGPLVNGIEDFEKGNIIVKISAKTPYEKKQVVQRAIRKKVLEVANKNGIRLGVEKVEVKDN